MLGNFFKVPVDLPVRANFSLTFYDFLATLIPGLSFLLFLYFLGEFGFLQGNLDAQTILIALLAYSLVTGILLHALGNLLYNLYFHPSTFTKEKVWYWIVLIVHKLTKVLIREDYSVNNDQIKKSLIKLLKSKKLIIPKNKDGKTLFLLCDTLVATSGFLERDVLLAKQGFYRSLSALTIALFFYGMLRNWLGFPMLVWLIGCTLILRILLYAHTSYGKTRREQIYFLAYLKIKKVY